MRELELPLPNERALVQLLCVDLGAVRVNELQYLEGDDLSAAVACVPKLRQNFFRSKLAALSGSALL